LQKSEPKAAQGKHNCPCATENKKALAFPKGFFMERVRRVELPTLCLATMESEKNGNKNRYFSRLHPAITPRFP
jgi:hypothetical protein